MKSQSDMVSIPQKIITIPPVLDRNWVEQFNSLLYEKNRNLILDLSQTVRIDSAGLCFIKLLHLQCKNSGKKLILRNISSDHLNLLKTCNFSPQDKKSPDSFKNSFIVNTGDTLVKLMNNSVHALSVLTEMLYWGTFGLLKKQDFKRGALGEQMYQLGYKAFGIVTLLSFLIGIVLSLQSAIQLRNFGAGIFLAPLIGITMVREMGPLLTAIILAGRTGSATTAEIATMGVGEELDALQTMGINPIQFAVVPKFWAISITMPILSILATAAGILGGFLVAITYLDLSSSIFWGELSKHLHLRDLNAGFIKSVVFSWLIVWIGSYYGLRVKGGAEAVGRETTASVVTGIFIIILADAIFSFIL